MNLSRYSLLLKAPLRLRCTVTGASTRLRSISLRFYSSETSSPKFKLFRDANPLSDLVGEITLPNGTTSSLKFARLPASPPAGEISTACLFWGETKTALEASGFQPGRPPSPSGPDMYTIGPSAVAGTGVFAKRDIESGETIIVERPFFMEASQPPPDCPDPDVLGPLPFACTVLVVTKRLEKREQIDLFQLFSSDHSVYQIMSQNAITIDDPLPGSYQGVHSIVCKDVSRINHSCTPNVDLRWDATSFTVSISSTTRISKGEELVRSYGALLPPRAERREILQNQYDFECSCPSCSLPDSESSQSDDRRRLLQDDLGRLDPADDPEFSAWLSDASLPDDHVISRIEELVSAMESEGVQNVDFQVIHYTRLVRAYIALGDAEKAKFWASRILLASLHSVWAAEAKEWASKTMARPESDNEWGLRQKARGRGT
ncbi:hypothetical protein C8J57DRAFT_1415465 [Mycena rebaudengoi]|nr:hypothetical protein C8J57DRAFT_1415465 [Mycena rebaudengoi]